MVKITNPLGEVKIGRQGEVVYQRKYGQQIRRQASPKRAIASEAQIAHRQLYRDALTWRSQLSLANRRYLDGYCIANGIVDSYHIPLPWSRFALKLYLQSIKFVPMLELEETPPVAGEKKDANEYAHSSSYAIQEAIWDAQTFTPLEAYTIGSVFIAGCRVAGAHPLILGIRLTDGEGKPTGGDLTSGQVSTGIFPPYGTYPFREIAFTPVALSEGVKYAYVTRVPDAPYGDRFVVSHSGNDAHYPRGSQYYSPNSGSTWTKQNRDTRFQVWSAEQAGTKYKAGILHVRHPALMKVAHKRNGVIVNGYDTLSSLDEEYLTGQAGVDVEEGDSIVATTLPGIEYAYLVK